MKLRRQIAIIQKHEQAKRLPEKHVLKQLVHHYDTIPPHKKRRLQRKSFCHEASSSNLTLTAPREATTTLSLNPLELSKQNPAFVLHHSFTWNSIDLKFPSADYCRCFTDASLQGKTAGLGCYIEWPTDPPEEHSLPGDPTWAISDLEMKCILRGLHLCRLHQPNEPIVLFTDSLAALHILHRSYTSLLPFSALVEDIHRAIDTLTHLTQQTVTLHWVPGHKDIPGNEKADSLAKQGVKLPAATYPLPIHIARRQVNTAALKEWITRWKNSNKARIYAKYRHKPVKKDAINRLLRHHQVLITKLRLRNFPTAQWKHKLDRNHSPLCACGRTETVAHILIYCNLTNPDRLTTWGSTPPTIHRALFGGQEDIQKTIDFLATTNRLKCEHQAKSTQPPSNTN